MSHSNGMGTETWEWWQVLGFSSDAETVAFGHQKVGKRCDILKDVTFWPKHKKEQ